MLFMDGMLVCLIPNYVSQMLHIIGSSSFDFALRDNGGHPVTFRKFFILEIIVWPRYGQRNHFGVPVLDSPYLWSGTCTKSENWITVVICLYFLLLAKTN